MIAGNDYERKVTELQPRPIVTDNTRQEITSYEMDDFPLSMDKQLVSRKDIAGIPHWHYEIQISVVSSGSVIFRTPTGEHRLRKGEGIFINSGVLHEIVSTEEKDSEYLCINFDPQMLCGDSDRLIRDKYIDPVLSSSGLPIFLLREKEWQKKICSLVFRAGDLSDQKRYGFELSLKVILYRIWELIVLHCREQLLKSISINQSDRERLADFCDYIHDNYMKHISLSDIADSGHVSRGECCRLFKRTRNESPMAYLMKYRIRQSIKLMTCTNLTMTEIAQQTGFNTSSYFAECFKKEIGTTPIKYKNMIFQITPES